MTNVFYDAAKWAMIPRQVDALLYVDGEFAAPSDAPRILQLQRVRWITVKADYRRAGAIDLLEQPWYTPGMLRAYVRGRRSMGKLARVYVDEAQAAEAVAALRDWGNGELLDYAGLYWWISTLDGRVLSPAELAAELAARWEAPEIEADHIWAHQRLDLGDYDESDLYLPW